MRQMTLNNALNENNVWFRVTPEQAKQIKSNTVLDVSFVIITDKIITLDYDENRFLTFLEHQYKNSLEQIQIIDEVPFKTQKEVWEFLVSNEENVVKHTLDGRKVSFVNGELFNISSEYPDNIAFTTPNLWKPSPELYKPKLKGWWELNNNKPTLCWYSDTLDSIIQKEASIALVTRQDNKFKKINSDITWKYAIPLTEEDFKKFTFKSLDN